MLNRSQIENSGQCSNLARQALCQGRQWYHYRQGKILKVHSLSFRGQFSGSLRCFRHSKLPAEQASPSGAVRFIFCLKNLLCMCESLLSPSLGPRLSPLKTGGGESLVTFARKAVDFRRIISHVINEGDS